MKPVDYLTKEEKSILSYLKEGIHKCETVEDLRLLEEVLDSLLTKSVRRYQKTLN